MSRSSLLESGAKSGLDYLAKLGKWLSCVVSTYLYGAFDCMYLSCHVCSRVNPHSKVALMSKSSLLEQALDSLWNAYVTWQEKKLEEILGEPKKLWKNPKKLEENIGEPKELWKNPKKLEEDIGEPKELWKNLKKLGLPKSKTSPTNIFLKENDGLSLCSLSIANNLKELFSNLARNLIEKLPTGPNKFDINSVR